MIKNTLTAILLFVTITSSFAEVMVTSTSNDRPYDISEQVYQVIDEGGDYSFDMLMGGELDNKLKASKISTFYFKDKMPHQWYRFSIENTTNDYKRLVFSVQNQLIMDMTFFSSLDSTHTTTGAMHPYDQRQFNDKNYLFYIELNPKQKGDFGLYIAEQPYTAHVHLSLEPLELHNLNADKEKSVSLGYYSLGVFIILILLLLYYSEDNKMYLFFLGFIVSLILFRLWHDGVLFRIIWPNLPFLNISMGKFLYLVTFGGYILFIYKLFRIEEDRKSIVKALRFIFFGLVGVILIQFFVQSMHFYYYTILIYTLFSIVVTVVGVRFAYLSSHNYKGLHVFIFAVYLFSIIANILHISGAKGVFVGDWQFSFGVLFLFFGLVAIVFTLKYQKTKSEILAMNTNLESLVEKRTSQLSQQKEELRAQHEELLQQKEILQTQREELRAQKELLEMKNSELEKLSIVASKTDNLIYIFSPNGELDWFNTSFGILFEMTIDEYNQRDKKLHISDLGNNNNSKHIFNTCLREKTPVSYESSHERIGGDTIWHHTTLTPILDEEDNIKMLIAIDTNITRLKIFEDELNEQRKQAEIQRNLAVARGTDLEEQQVRVMDSIRYAKRIQSAIMPKAKQIQRDFYDSFVLFLPKDIVSGDFYWYHRIGDKYFIAAVDCTGHGVPGAFMSIIGNYLLNSIIINNEVYDPVEILKQLNRKIKIALKADNRVQTSDGMDIALAVINKKENKLEYAGALRPMFLFSGGKFIEVKGDKIPITSSISGTSLNSYTKHTFDFNYGDFFYIFSDGIIDQFGGDIGKKFLTKRFKELLFEISPLTMREQKVIIKKAFDEWRGSDYEQVDDVLVIGLRYKEDER